MKKRSNNFLPLMYCIAGEKLVSSLSRLVLTIWLFVVLILTSSYTASLTSLLTVKQLKPTVKNVDSIRASGEAVGYQNGSFVAEYLHREFGIAKGKLRTYASPEEAGELLSKGPTNGGVAAIFDEIPYIRIFLASQCGYTMVGPIYKTGGFGFVFPKDSPLVSDISRAVLSLSEDKEMQEIETKWLTSSDCTDSETKVDSSRLSIDSFWGLYLITGTASLITLTIFFTMLFYDYKRDPNVKAHNDNDMRDLSAGTPLKSLSRAMKLFIEYVDQKEDSTSAPNPKVPTSPTDCSCSTPTFAGGPSDIGMNTLVTSTSTFSSTRFSFLDKDHAAFAD